MSLFYKITPHVDIMLNPKILAVDDDVNIRRIIKMRLERAGYQVELQEDGQAALACIKGMDPETPDLILCDVTMPGMDGYTFCLEVRRLGIRCPFLFLTKNAHREDKARGLEVGANDYVLKPFNPSELEAKIASYLRKDP